MKYRYLASSERCSWRSDEIENEFRLTRKLNVGDTFTFDGIEWTVIAKL